MKTRAPLDEAPCAMLSCECSLSATMYSASSSPLATICASAIMVAVYGRIGYAVITSTSAYLAACAAATQPLIRTVFFFCQRRRHGFSSCLMHVGPTCRSGEFSPLEVGLLLSGPL